MLVPFGPTVLVHHQKIKSEVYSSVDIFDKYSGVVIDIKTADSRLSLNDLVYFTDVLMRKEMHGEHYSVVKIEDIVAKESK